jgi:hypothetical protein
MVEDSMADSVGSGFPTTGINKGHVFYDLDERALYRYIGGNPTLSSSWILMNGQFITHPDTTLWGDRQKGAIWFSINNGGFFGWDGSGVISVGGSGGYSTIQQNGVDIVERSTLNIVGKSFELKDIGGVSRLALNDLSLMSYEFDDFVSGGFTLFLASGGKLGWFLNAVGSGGFAVGHDSGHPGIIIAFTSTTIGSRAFMYVPGSTSSPGWINFSDTWDISYSVRFTAVDANTEIKIGLAGDVGSFIPGVYVEKLFADTDVFAVSKDGVGTTRQSLFTPVINTWYVIRIRKSGSDVVFSIDGVDTVTISTDLPGSGVALASELSVENNAGVDKQVWCDYYECLVTGLVR